MRQGALPDLGLDDGGSAAPIPTMRVSPEQQAVEQPPAEAEAVEQPPAEAEVAQPVTEAAPVSPPVTQAAPGVEPAAQPAKIEMKADGPPPVAGVVAPPPPEYDPNIAKMCDRFVTDFWAPGEYYIDGRMFWLSGVFTIDYNGDGRIDDVGFKLNAEGKIGNVLNYFPSSGDRLSGKTVASLKLGDERDIGRLCADNVTFDRPEPEIAAPMQGAATPTERSVPGAVSAADAAKKASEAEPEKQPEPEPEVKAKVTAEEKTLSLIMWMGGMAMVLMLFGIVGFIFFLKGTISSSDDDDDDDDDDNDNDNDNEYEHEDED